MEEARVAMPSLGFWNPSDYVGIDNYKKNTNDNKISAIDPLGFFLHLLYRFKKVASFLVIFFTS